MSRTPERLTTVHFWSALVGRAVNLINNGSPEEFFEWNPGAGALYQGHKIMWTIVRAFIRSLRLSPAKELYQNTIKIPHWLHSKFEKKKTTILCRGKVVYFSVWHKFWYSQQNEMSGISKMEKIQWLAVVCSSHIPPEKNLCQKRSETTCQEVGCGGHPRQRTLFHSAFSC